MPFFHSLLFRYGVCNRAEDFSTGTKQTDGRTRGMRGILNRLSNNRIFFPDTMSQRTIMYIQLVASMALWGGTWIAGRILAQSMHPMSAALLRFILASAYLLLICRKADGRLPRLQKGQLLPVCFLGLTGVFLYSIFFFNGLKTVPAGRAALIVACIPVCIGATSALLYKERFGTQRILGTVLSLIGVSVVIAGNPLALLHGGVHSGDLLILGCVVSWTGYSLGGKSVMQRMPPLHAVTWSCVTGALFLLPAALLTGVAGDIVRAGFLQWFCLVFLGVLATGMAYYWYYRAIPVIGASRAGIFINLVPLFAVLLGALLLGEAIHATLIGGGLLIITGVWLNNRA